MKSFSSHFDSTIKDFSKKFNKIIQLSAGPGSRVAEAMRYATEEGGKRIRPFLVLETARMLGANPKDQMFFDAAAAVELIHSYSLIHDDLPAMDNDDYRRGKPTVHRQYDEAIAILAGDGLLTLAFEIASPYPVAVRTLARAAGYQGMVAGQALDLAHMKHPFKDEKTLTRLVQLKTGALFTYSLTVSALLLKTPETTVKHLSDYANWLGLLFQVTDNMLDNEGDMEMNAHYAKICAERALEALEDFSHDADYLREMITIILKREK